MPSYSYRTQVAVDVATMGIHNFLRQSRVVEEAFRRAEEDDDDAEVELPSAEDEMHAEMHAPKLQRSEWDRLRDYLVQQP